MHYTTLCVAALMALMATPSHQAPWDMAGVPSGGQSGIPGAGSRIDIEEQVKEMLLEQLQKEEADNAKAQAEQKKAAACRPDYSSPNNDWMWQPPTPCRFVNSTGAILHRESCTGGFQCAIGPLPVTVNGTAGDAYFCGYYTAPVLLYHACRVFDLANQAAVKVQGCAPGYGSCNLGPADIFDGDSHLQAYYCSGLPTSWLNQPYTTLDRACRAVDSSYYIIFQRHCPDNFVCASEPQPVKFQDKTTGYAFTCVFDNSSMNGTSGGMSLPANMTLQDVLGYLIYVRLERYASGSSEISDIENQLLEKVLEFMKQNGGQLVGSNDQEKFLVFVFTRLMKVEQNVAELDGQRMAFIAGLFHELAADKARSYALMQILKAIVHHAQEAQSEVEDEIHAMVAKVLHELLGRMDGPIDKLDALKKLLMKMMANQNGDMGDGLKIILGMLLDGNSNSGQAGGMQGLLQILMGAQSQGQQGSQGGGMAGLVGQLVSGGADRTRFINVIQSLLQMMQDGRDHRDNNDVILQVIYQIVKNTMGNQPGASNGGASQGSGTAAGGMAGQGDAFGVIQLLLQMGGDDPKIMQIIQQLISHAASGGDSPTPTTPKSPIAHLLVVMKQIESRTDDPIVHGVLNALMSLAEISIQNPSDSNLPLIGALLDSVLEKVGNASPDLIVLKLLIKHALENKSAGGMPWGNGQ